MDVRRTTRNLLLASLPEAALNCFENELELVFLELGEVVYESDEKLSFVYFPTTAIVSLLYVMEKGASAEIAIIGFDGFVGHSVFMGGDSTTGRAVVQSAGEALRIDVRNFRDAMARVDEFQPILLLYSQALLTQMSQTAVCNRLHSVEEQLCRWLLLSHDRLDDDEIVMTQALIGNMLGVSREGVSHAAHGLQEAGLIHFARGRITITDRQGLEDQVCECYQVVKSETTRLESLQSGLYNAC